MVKNKYVHELMVETQNKYIQKVGTTKKMNHKNAVFKGEKMNSYQDIFVQYHVLFGTHIRG